MGFPPSVWLVAVRIQQTRQEFKCLSIVFGCGTEIELLHLDTTGIERPLYYFDLLLFEC